MEDGKEYLKTDDKFNEYLKKEYDTRCVLENILIIVLIVLLIYFFFRDEINEGFVAVRCEADDFLQYYDTSFNTAGKHIRDDIVYLAD